MFLTVLGRPHLRIKLVSTRFVILFMKKEEGAEKHMRFLNKRPEGFEKILPYVSTSTRIDIMNRLVGSLYCFFVSLFKYLTSSILHQLIWHRGFPVCCHFRTRDRTLVPTLFTQKVVQPGATG